MRVSIIFLMAFFMAGCTDETKQEDITLEVSGCKADEYKHLLWQPESALEGLNFPKFTRIIRPGMAVTMDYNPQRLNIDIGKLGRIERVYCG